MREIRLSGSEGGAARTIAPSLPLSCLFFALGVYRIKLNLIVILLVIVIFLPASAYAFQLPQRQTGCLDVELRIE